MQEMDSVDKIDPHNLAPADCDRLRSLPQRFADIKILVVGDLIIDEFVWGQVRRISPEAPVPVVQVTDRSLRLGGAANVVHNLRMLGAQVLVSGIVGDDEPGGWLIDTLQAKGVPVDGILRDPRRPSTMKTRVIAHSQQVVRIDHENCFPVEGFQEKQLCDYIRRRAAEVDGIIISDYAKGVVSEGVMDTVRTARRAEQVVAVDPKVSRFSLYRDVTVVTPNHREAVQAVGMEGAGEQDLPAVGVRLMDDLRCSILLITRGEKGMSLFLQDDHLDIPTVAREVFDVTGAGDTVISVFTLGLCVGATPREAALLANMAAGVVVSEIGTAAVSTECLQRALVANRQDPAP
jgi:rfaE bifunctional protein kinase chain/domain